MIKVTVTGRRAKAVTDDELAVESCGVPVKFIFTDEWNNLDKVACFTCGDSRVQVHLEGDECELPDVGAGTLRICVYGTGYGLTIPTTEVVVGEVRGSASCTE